MREQEAGTKTGCVPQASDQPGDVISMKAKFSGLEVSEARRLRALEAENVR